MPKSTAANSAKHCTSPTPNRCRTVIRCATRGLAPELFLWVAAPEEPGSSTSAATSKRSKRGLQSLCDNLCAKRFCSVGLQADTVDASTCTPEGGRYIDQNQVRTQTLKPRPPKHHNRSGDFKIRTLPVQRGDRARARSQS